MTVRIDSCGSLPTFLGRYSWSMVQKKKKRAKGLTLKLALELLKFILFLTPHIKVMHLHYFHEVVDFLAIKIKGNDLYFHIFILQLSESFLHFNNVYNLVKDIDSSLHSILKNIIHYSLDMKRI